MTVQPVHAAVAFSSDYIHVTRIIVCRELSAMAGLKLAPNCESLDICVRLNHKSRLLPS